MLARAKEYHVAKNHAVEQATLSRSANGRGYPTMAGVDRRAQLVDTAAKLFRARGYNATSLQDLADVVGIQKASFYHYIETKEDLLFAIVEAVHDATEKGNTGWQDAPGGALGQIRSFVEGHLRISIANLEYAEVFFRDSRSLSAERQAVIVEARDRYESVLKKLVADAVGEGRVRKDLDPSLATRVVFGMMNWIYLWYRADGPLGVDELVSQIADFAMASLAELPAER